MTARTLAILIVIISGVLVTSLAETATANGCWTGIVNDYGPSGRIYPERIADVALVHWTAVCGLPASAGLCHMDATVLRSLDLPATDAERPVEVEP